MLPARNNKIDLSKLTDEERKIFKLYGKLPTGKDILTHKLKERKYFDSGDYALSKAGKAQGPVGSQHPSPETVPHANAIASQTHNSSPVKESSLVHERITSAVPTSVPAASAVSVSSSTPAPVPAPVLAPAQAAVPASGPAPVPASGPAPVPVTPSAVPAATVPVSGSSEATTPASDATEVTTSIPALGTSEASADPPDDATVAPVSSPAPAIKSQ